MLPPDAKSYLVPSEDTILICTGPEQIALAQRLINELDRPKKNYRLTYTLTEMDGAKRVNTDHLSMVLAPGQSSTLKRGSKVPIATGTFAPKGETASANPSSQTQYTYLDVGMNLQATLSSMENLKTSIERSSVAEEPSGVGPQDPIVRQVSLRTDSLAPLGKPLLLGSVDLPDTTRHLEVEVKVEELP
jgi:type II secretory pathway component GspD/PulD (secretin)